MTSEVLQTLVKYPGSSKVAKAQVYQMGNSLESEEGGGGQGVLLSHPNIQTRPSPEKNCKQEHENNRCGIRVDKTKAQGKRKKGNKFP